MGVVQQGLRLVTWSPVLPLSGLHFSPGPGTEQALRTAWVMKPDSLYLKRNFLPHQPLHSTQRQTQGGQATRRKDSSPPGLLHPRSFLEISQRTEHPQHTPSFWGHCSCLKGPHPKLRPPEQASTSLCTVYGSRGWEEAVRNTCFHI